MLAVIKKSFLNGEVVAPPSKSMAHRLLIFASLAKGISKISNIAYSQDILATLDCLEAFGAKFEKEKDCIIVDGKNLFKDVKTSCNARESGSTLRFLIPLAWVCGKRMEFYGSERLLQRPLEIYEKIAKENYFYFENDGKKIITEGKLKPGKYQVVGNVSSQFITGLIIALSLLEKPSEIEIVSNFESASYVNLTIAAAQSFLGKVELIDNHIYIKPSVYQSLNCEVEADDSNAAFLDCYNFLGSNVAIKGLNPNSIQGDRFYHHYFELLQSSNPTISLKDCPDLGPILMAMAAVKNGATFLDTYRLAAKECDRAMAMKQELAKFGSQLTVEENRVIVEKTELYTPNEEIDGHNDHRIVMAMSVLCTLFGGKINGCEAINKSFPDYFDKIKKLGASVEKI